MYSTGKRYLSKHIYLAILLILVVCSMLPHVASANLATALTSHTFSLDQKEYSVKYTITGAFATDDIDTQKNFLLFFAPKLEPLNLVSTPIIGDREKTVPAATPTYAAYTFNLCYFHPQPNEEFLYKFADSKGFIYRTDYFTAPNKDYSETGLCPSDQSQGIGHIDALVDGQVVNSSNPLANNTNVNTSGNVNTNNNVNINTIIANSQPVGHLDPNHTGQVVNTYTILPSHVYTVNEVIPQAQITLTPNTGVVSLANASYQGSAKITIVKEGRLSLKVRWGLSADNLAYSTNVFNNGQSIIDDAVVQGVGGYLNATFSLNFLTKNKTYYYQYVDGRNPTIQYGTVQSFDTGNIPNTPIPQATITVTPGKGIASNGGVYQGFAKVMATSAGKVSLGIKWGNASGSLNKTASVYLGNSRQIIDGYVLSGLGDSINASFSLENLPKNATYYYQYVDLHTGTAYGDQQSFVIGDLSKPTETVSNTVLISTATSGFYITINPGGALTPTTFKGSAEVTADKKATTVSLVVVWGADKDHLDKTAEVYINNPASTTAQRLGSYLLAERGDTVPVTFTLDGLEGQDSGKTYYYAFAKPGSTDSRYTEPQPVVVYGTGQQQASTPAPAAATTGGDISLGLIDELKGGLVPCTGSSEDPCTFEKLLQLVNNVIKFFIYLTIPIATIVFAYVGYTYLTSGGSSEARTKAKHAFKNVFIGLILVLGAWLIVATILDALGVAGAYRFI